MPLAQIYDTEIYPNFFCVTFEMVDSGLQWYFEISEWRNDAEALCEFLELCRYMDQEHIGFNNEGFDYPILHLITRMRRSVTNGDIYKKCQDIIKSQDFNRFAHTVRPTDRMVKQIDLFKIHHYDNKARATGLKHLEFMMQMANVEELPFPPGTVLTLEQARLVRKYNRNDIAATKKFYHKSLEAIEFRKKLTHQYGIDFTNYNDTKIGAKLFELRLEAAGIQLYEYGEDGRTPRQTKRATMALAECIPSYIRFQSQGFNSIVEFFRGKVITETKGVFTDLSTWFNGLEYVFGVGGIHASVNAKVYHSDAEREIIDADVTSMYPSIIIANNIYPAHLGAEFLPPYIEVRDLRVSFAKGTVENAALKLALNGVYGKMNDQFSVFFDPLAMMKVTIAGQLSLAMLAERLSVAIPAIEIIQLNTDGITVRIPRSARQAYDAVCKQWEADTKLPLEFAHYESMWIRDVNNYIAKTTSGKVKRKGAYEHNVEWHKDGSMAVVAKVAEKVLVEGAPIRETVENWSDIMDFMVRVKIPRSSHLIGEYQGHDYTLPNMTRCYAARDGYMLTKLMPPLKGKPDWRRISVMAGTRVCFCNDITQANLPIDYDFYINEVEKLVLPLTEV